jgi:Raf kinase inhibitor-like YbhB/YbcL family protein
MKHSFLTEEATRAVDFKVLQVSTPDISGNGELPVRFTAQGDNINPSLFVQHIPQDAKSLAVVMHDKGGNIYWLAWNIPVTHHIKENEPHGTAGVNSFGNQRYDGPEETAEFADITVKMYALKSILPLGAGASLKELEKEMSDEILAFGCLEFNRQNQQI